MCIDTVCSVSYQYIKVLNYVHDLQEEDTFKQKVLGSLSDELIQAKQQLSTVTKQQTTCLEEYLASQTLVRWVKENLKSTELA